MQAAFCQGNPPPGPAASARRWTAIAAGPGLIQDWVEPCGFEARNAPTADPRRPSRPGVTNCQRRHARSHPRNRSVPDRLPRRRPALLIPGSQRPACGLHRRSLQRGRGGARTQHPSAVCAGAGRPSFRSGARRACRHPVRSEFSHLASPGNRRLLPADIRRRRGRDFAVRQAGSLFRGSRRQADRRSRRHDQRSDRCARRWTN